MTEELSAAEFYGKMYDDIYKALCVNHLNGAVAHFLAQLAIDVERIKRHEL